MSAVERVPWAVPPAPERHAISRQRFAFSVFHEPVRVLLKKMRFFFGDKRRNPDRRRKPALANFFKHALHITAKGRARLEPITHGRLITIVDLYVLQAR